MYIRCCDCLSATWIDAIQRDDLVRTTECGECGRRFVLDPIEDLGLCVRNHYRRALSYSNQQDLDMASAYAVLLGIMSLDQAQVLRRARLPEPAPTEQDDPELELELTPASEISDAAAARARRARADRLPLVPDFDLGYGKAIARGHLTVQQAMTRGDRDAFASRLMRAHGLARDLAYRVADNCVGLRQALELKQREEEEQAATATAEAKVAAPRRSPGSRVSRWAVIGLAAAGLSVMIWNVWSSQLVAERTPVLQRSDASPAPGVPGPASPPPSAAGSDPLIAATEVRTDETGQVLEVVGPDPATVLVTYCEASPSILGLAPLEITSTVPRFRNARLGVFRDVGAVDSLRSIRIRKDARTGRWVAGGSGDTPIRVSQAPEFSPDALRIPVSNR
jgi:hypothetical protein